jgi:hypothetical protein
VTDSKDTLAKVGEGEWYKKYWDIILWTCLILAFLIWVFAASEKRRFEFLTECAAAGGATISTRAGNYCTRAENIIEFNDNDKGEH